VIPTRNRRDRLLATLAGCVHFPTARPSSVIDNASADSTAAAVRRVYPGPAHRSHRWDRLSGAHASRPLTTAVRLTIVMTVRRDGGRRALLTALPGLPWIARERRVVPLRVEASLRALDVER